MPYPFLFIGHINARPEFQTEFAGFSAGPTRYIFHNNRGSVVTLEHPSLSSDFVVALSWQLLMLLYKSVCCDKVVKCRDICVAPMSLAFVVSLS